MTDDAAHRIPPAARGAVRLVRKLSWPYAAADPGRAA
jgi:hypothetical protein